MVAGEGEMTAPLVTPVSVGGGLVPVEHGRCGANFCDVTLQ
jgi:hypothetical protein